MAIACNQTEMRGRGGAPRCGMGRSRASAFNHHQFPARTSLGHHLGRGAARCARLGHFSGFPELADYLARRKTGLHPDLLREPFNMAGHLSSQAIVDLPKLHLVNLSKADINCPDSDSDGGQKIGFPRQTEDAP